MSVVKRIVPPVPRGQDRRALPRQGQTDWRVNQRSYNFLGTTFDPLTPMQTLSRAKWMTIDHGFRYIVTPNVDHIVSFTKHPEWKAPFEASWLAVCDSRILELLAAFSGIPLKAVPGSDLTQQLFENVISEDDIINVVGADEEIVEIIKSKYGVSTINHHQPPMGLREKPEAIAAAAAFVAENKARYTVFCVGAPQQEMIAKACLDRGDCVGLGLCVGASLDFLSGRSKRAPKWMQKSRLEWLFRLASEPKRLWKRYLADGPKIFWLWAKWSLSNK